MLQPATSSTSAGPLRRLLGTAPQRGPAAEPPQAGGEQLGARLDAAERNLQRLGSLAGEVRDALSVLPRVRHGSDERRLLADAESELSEAALEVLDDEFADRRARLAALRSAAARAAAQLAEPGSSGARAAAGALAALRGFRGRAALRAELLAQWTRAAAEVHGGSTGRDTGNFIAATWAAGQPSLGGSPVVLPAVLATVDLQLDRRSLPTAVAVAPVAGAQGKAARWVAVLARRSGEPCALSTGAPTGQLVHATLEEVPAAGADARGGTVFRVARETALPIALGDAQRASQGAVVSGPSLWQRRGQLWVSLALAVPAPDGAANQSVAPFVVSLEAAVRAPERPLRAAPLIAPPSVRARASDAAALVFEAQGDLWAELSVEPHVVCRLGVQGWALSACSETAEPQLQALTAAAADPRAPAAVLRGMAGPVSIASRRVPVLRDAKGGPDSVLLGIAQLHRGRSCRSLWYAFAPHPPFAVTLASRLWCLPRRTGESGECGAEDGCERAGGLYAEGPLLVASFGGCSARIVRFDAATVLRELRPLPPS
eukprot:TRINITY_DN29502_c0_g1_i2.p1 TRINITY_DN29502_c0_g1~~TRINITY_DN29502_c0_g1_i2.p1  ORF type:complete len:601 (+),score=131.87 TRINITY_DN29502_c0_g1_i2:170-1804(+)